jgi:hypothetical protein
MKRPRDSPSPVANDAHTKRTKQVPLVGVDEITLDDDANERGGDNDGDATERPTSVQSSASARERRLEEERRENAVRLARTFCDRFADTVINEEHPVCAADDLRFTDLFSRFVEHQCAANLTATIDVIKSTFVRFPSHVSLPPSQVCVCARIGHLLNLTA